jgi:hypothetical protein
MTYIAMQTHNVQNQVFGVGFTRSTESIDKYDFSMMGMHRLCHCRLHIAHH